MQGDDRSGAGAGAAISQRDLGPGDHVRIGSVTKTLTGTMILQAAQRGALRLDDPVWRFRADVPNGKHITIEQLLSMRPQSFAPRTSLRANDRAPATRAHLRLKPTRLIDWS